MVSNWRSRPTDRFLGGDQTREESAGQHCMPKREVTVIYSRNKVEAATKQTIHAEGFLQVNIPWSLREIGACKNCNQVVKEGHWERCFAKLRVFGNHHYLWASHSHWCLCLFRLWVFGRHYYSWLCDGHWGLCLVSDRHWERCLQDCMSLEGITIPESVTDIGMRAFCGCRPLRSITISLIL